jgi:hypothetical protein
MNGREDLIISVVSTSFTLALLQTNETIHLSNWELAIGISIAAVASLMPDNDHPDSTITRASLGIMFMGLFLYFIPLGDFSKLFPPDSFTWLDHFQSILSSWSWQQIFGAALVLVSLMMVINSHLLEHRGPAHSLLCWFVESICIFVVYQNTKSPYALIYTLCFSWGILSHLIADCFTAGYPPDLFWPLSIDISELSSGFIEKITNELDEIWFRIRML